MLREFTEMFSKMLSLYLPDMVMGWGPIPFLLAPGAVNGIETKGHLEVGKSLFMKLISYRACKTHINKIDTSCYQYLTRRDGCMDVPYNPGAYPDIWCYCFCR